MNNMNIRRQFCRRKFFIYGKNFFYSYEMNCDIIITGIFARSARRQIEAEGRRNSIWENILELTDFAERQAWI